MALLSIAKYPDPVLKKPCRPVETIDEEILQILQDMAETMYANSGVGLAAPQVGRSLRLIVVDVNRGEEESQLLRLINPRIIDKSEEIKSEEGCLSLPELIVEVDRFARVTLEALLPSGEPVTIEADGLLAVALQHETDHLDGVLLVDRLSSLRRSLYGRKMAREASIDTNT